MPASMKKTKWVCSECLSDDLVMDATATWDFDKQEWEYGLCGCEGFCQNCKEQDTAVNISFPNSVWVELDRANRESISFLIDYLYMIDLSDIQFEYIKKLIEEAIADCSIDPQDNLVTLFMAIQTTRDL